MIAMIRQSHGAISHNPRPPHKLGRQKLAIAVDGMCVKIDQDNPSPENLIYFFIKPCPSGKEVPLFNTIGFPGQQGFRVF
jgi:hypothetical protein